jgi:hypothetical protein
MTNATHTYKTSENGSSPGLSTCMRTALVVNVPSTTIMHHHPQRTHHKRRSPITPTGRCTPAVMTPFHQDGTQHHQAPHLPNVVVPEDNSLSMKALPHPVERPVPPTNSTDVLTIDKVQPGVARRKTGRLYATRRVYLTRRLHRTRRLPENVAGRQNQQLAMTRP